MCRTGQPVAECLAQERIHSGASCVLYQANRIPADTHPFDPEPTAAAADGIQHKTLGKSDTAATVLFPGPGTRGSTTSGTLRSTAAICSGHCTVPLLPAR